MVKKVILNIVNVVSVIAIAASIIVLLTVVLTKSGDVPSLFGYSVFRVLTGSMEPTIETDSLIIVHRIDTSEIEEGDIISFFSKDPSHGGAVNTHRVTVIEENGDSRNFVTRGDANQIDDRYLTSEEDVIGEVVFVSHPLGVLVRLLSNPLIFIPLVALPLLVILLFNLSRTVRLTKNMMREEEEAAVREALETLRRKRAERAEDMDDTEEEH